MVHRNLFYSRDSNIQDRKNGVMEENYFFGRVGRATSKIYFQKLTCAACFQTKMIFKKKSKELYQRNIFIEGYCEIYMAEK